MYRYLPKIAGYGAESGYNGQRPGSSDLDPCQNATNPQHCRQVSTVPYDITLPVRNARDEKK
jgi:hypothetical protein